MNILYDNIEHDAFLWGFVNVLLEFGNIKFLSFITEKIYWQQNNGLRELHFFVLSKTKVSELGTLRE